MNTQVCVNCRNEKPVNMTTNRLVTESCGHIKCMDCLLHEKAGCSACSREKALQGYQDSPEEEKKKNTDDSSEQTDVMLMSEKESEEIQVQCDVVFDAIKKKKPETSHIKVENDAEGRFYVCTLCKKKFHARSQVAYHAYCNGQRKPFQCPECNKSFATHSHFKYHMRVHRNERTYACDACGESFFQMSKLQRHKLKHTKEKKYSCDKCSKGFSSVSSLRKHAVTHTEERPYACAVCGCRLRDPSNYRKHLAKHDAEKKCECGSGECGRCTHTGPPRRAHQCPRCPRAFHSRKDMRRHLAVHTDSKPFRCKVCNRRFRRKDNLERHIRNTHPAYVPASAVDCDVLALKQIAVSNPPASPDAASPPSYPPERSLKILNPLPPLPQEVIRRHISAEDDENVDLNRQKDSTRPRHVIDKSYIIEANHARQSVIVGKCTFDRKIPSSDGNEYVHKIRRANSMASHKNVPLPPIDEKKMIELEQKTSFNSLDVGAPPKDVELYKKILYEKSEIDVSVEDEKRVQPSSTSPEMHWRRKMKLNINW